MRTTSCASQPLTARLTAAERVLTVTQKLTAVRQVAGAQQPVSYVPHVQAPPAAGSPIVVRTAAAGRRSARHVTRDCLIAAQQRACRHLVTTVTNSVVWLSRGYLLQAAQADVAVHLKRPASAAGLLPDPRLLQRARADSPQRTNADSPTPKQYRPEVPTRMPSIPAVASAPAAPAPAAVSGALQPKPLPASSSGTAHRAIPSGQRIDPIAAPAASVPHSGVPGLGAPPAASTSGFQRPPSASYGMTASPALFIASGVQTASASVAPAAGRLPVPSSLRPASLSKPAPPTGPTVIEPPGLQDDPAPAPLSPVFIQPSLAGSPPAKQRMQRAAGNVQQPVASQLPPPTWRPGLQQPPQQPQQQALPALQATPGAVPPGNGATAPQMQSLKQHPNSPAQASANHQQPRGVTGLAANGLDLAPSASRPAPLQRALDLTLVDLDLPPDVVLTPEQVHF